MENSKPSNYNFFDYRKEVIEFIKQTDKRFGLDFGKVGMVLSNPANYFDTIKKLNKYIRAKVDNKNLSIADCLRLKGLRKCLDFREELLACKLSLVIGNPKVMEVYHQFSKEI